MDMSSKWTGPSRPLPKSEPIDLSFLGNYEEWLGDPDEAVSILSSRFTYPDPTAIPPLEEFAKEFIDVAISCMQNDTLNGEGDRSSAKG
ncbi:hypothetical protein M514_04607 [Trichuris suis]|uniref:Uncharacterized protein n=1 Tax=Trichuris suis TaxID=68888 RepID=A0A085NV28_9BILA|nr:hypothetical protein M513_04607 [Trichuris suis]KFD73324.1 hypothetical protein M514_04607 [Trichuris suis]